MEYRILEKGKHLRCRFVYEKDGKYVLQHTNESTGKKTEYTRTKRGLRPLEDLWWVSGSAYPGGGYVYTERQSPVFNEICKIAVLVMCDKHGKPLINCTGILPSGDPAARNQALNEPNKLIPERR